MKRTRKGEKILSKEAKTEKPSLKTKRTHIDISLEEKKDEIEAEKPLIRKKFKLERGKIKVVQLEKNETNEPAEAKMKGRGRVHRKLSLNPRGLGIRSLRQEKKPEEIKEVKPETKKKSEAKYLTTTDIELDLKKLNLDPIEKKKGYLCDK